MVQLSIEDEQIRFRHFLTAAFKGEDHLLNECLVEQEGNTEEQELKEVFEPRGRFHFHRTEIDILVLILKDGYEDSHIDEGESNQVVE